MQCLCDDNFRALDPDCPVHGKDTWRARAEAHERERDTWKERAALEAQRNLDNGAARQEAERERDAAVQALAELPVSRVLALLRDIETCAGSTGLCQSCRVKISALIQDLERQVQS